jgi:hypothetical protein
MVEPKSRDPVKKGHYLRRVRSIRYQENEVIRSLDQFDNKSMVGQHGKEACGNHRVTTRSLFEMTTGMARV